MSFRATPNHQQLRPTPQDSCLPCLQHPGYLYHIDIGNPLRSLWVYLVSPNSRLLPFAPCRLRWFFRTTEYAEAVLLVHLQDSVG